jgi:hypothetical protein
MAADPYDTKLRQDLTAALEAKEVAPSSIQLYIRNLERLNGGPLKKMTFLKDVPAITAKLAAFAPNTQRGYLISICSVLQTGADSRPKKKLYDQYFALMMERNRAHKDLEATHEKSPAQAANWISWDEVVARHEELTKAVDSFKSAKAISPAQYDKLLQWVILSLYVALPPRRNSDYSKMIVTRAADGDSPADTNYLDWSGKRFIFNVFKTAKSEGQQVIPIPEPLAPVLATYLKFHPLLKGVRPTRAFAVPFLVYADGRTLAAVNSITRILNKVFGKRIGSSMLRHIYLTGKYGDVQAAQAEDARMMAHTVDQQRDYVKR